MLCLTTCSETEPNNGQKTVDHTKAGIGVRGPYTGGASGSRKLAPAICACCTSTSVTSKNLFCDPCSVKTSLCQTEDQVRNVRLLKHAVENPLDMREWRYVIMLVRQKKQPTDGMHIWQGSYTALEGTCVDKVSKQQLSLDTVTC